MKSYKVIYKKEAIKFIKIHKLEGTIFFRAFEEISKDITKINLYDIKDYHTSELEIFLDLELVNIEQFLRLIRM